MRPAQAEQSVSVHAQRGSTDGDDFQPFGGVGTSQAVFAVGGQIFVSLLRKIEKSD
jgi:hypothetical protein